MMKGPVRRYVVQVISLMVMYAGLLLLSIWLLGKHPAVFWSYPIAMLPAIPLCLVVWSVIQFIRTMDELQRSIHLEAVTFSFLVTIVVSLTYGFMENAGLPRIPLMCVPVFMCFLWGIGAGLVSRRYR
ncbi:MAG: hypothetical protein IRZ33_05825 [Alicyclobacillaceae bacterium]|nr:hypothetical protein [Alicyclobacillaceae bacterium]